MMNFHTFEIHRLADPDESGDFAYNRDLEDTYNCVTGFLEIATAEFAAIVDGEYGKTFRIFSDDLEADVAIGDRLVEGSEEYDVKGVQLTNDGPGRKLEIVVVKPIEQ